MRLREADSMAALAEMRQRVAELEIQVSGDGGMGWGGTRQGGKRGDRVTGGGRAPADPRAPAEGGGHDPGAAQPLGRRPVHPPAQGPHRRAQGRGKAPMGAAAPTSCAHGCRRTPYPAPTGAAGLRMLHPWVLGDPHPAPVGAGRPVPCAHGCCGTHVLHPQVLGDLYPVPTGSGVTHILYPWVLWHPCPAPTGAAGPCTLHPQVLWDPRPAPTSAGGSVPCTHGCWGTCTLYPWVLWDPHTGSSTHAMSQGPVPGAGGDPA